MKNKTPRGVTISKETVALLKAHKRHQSELKLRSGGKYHDLGLVFAKEWGDLEEPRQSLGHPLQMNNMGQHEYARITKAAGVRTIKFHGMRHTCATLLLQADVQAHVVQKWLGHKDISMTLGIYAHALPSMQADAASKMAGVLFGNG